MPPLAAEQNLDVAAQVPLDRLMIETDAPWCEVRPSHAGSRYKGASWPLLKSPLRAVRKGRLFCYNNATLPTPVSPKSEGREAAPAGQQSAEGSARWGWAQALAGHAGAHCTPQQARTGPALLPQVCEDQVGGQGQEEAGAGEAGEEPERALLHRAGGRRACCAVHAALPRAVLLRV